MIAISKPAFGHLYDFRNPPAWRRLKKCASAGKIRIVYGRTPQERGGRGVMVTVVRMMEDGLTVAQQHVLVADTHFEALGEALINRLSEAE